MVAIHADRTPPVVAQCAVPFPRSRPAGLPPSVLAWRVAAGVLAVTLVISAMVGGALVGRLLDAQRGIPVAAAQVEPG